MDKTWILFRGIWYNLSYLIQYNRTPSCAYLCFAHPTQTLCLSFGKQLDAELKAFLGLIDSYVTARQMK